MIEDACLGAVSPAARGRKARALGLWVLCCTATLAHAAPLLIGVITRADDERLESKRVELGYAGQPGGPLRQGVDVAIAESQFELDAAKLQVKVEAIEASSADDAKAQAARLEKAGAAALVIDLPTAWTQATAAATKLPLLNAGNTDNLLREQGCRANLFHTLPSERMLADALAQTLIARKWQRVLLLTGPAPEDQARSAVVQASMKRYGLKLVAQRPFKLSGDPRERDLANPLLLTGNTDYDAVWVVDTDGEFARGLPYRTALPRPVVGNGGLMAEAWAQRFERFGAPQLAKRFQKAQQRPMTGIDWAAWMATKAILQAALAGPPSKFIPAMTGPDFTLDGFKGSRLSFRAWDRQLRQPLLLTDGQGVISLAPVDGILHPKNVLDTLGADAPEKLCKAAS
jgi:ABC transporter substrate binding protein (PQQ-dependent alcohol dehydrogenase system)